MAYTVPRMPVMVPSRFPIISPVADVVASVRSGEVVLLPLFSPLDRTTQRLRYGERDDLFGIKVELAAEAAAHIRRDDSNLMLRMSSDQRHQQANKVRYLRGCPQRYMIGARVVIGDDCPTLHGVGDESLVHYALRDSHFSARGGSVNVATSDFPLEANIVRRIVMNLRRTIFRGCLGIHGGGQHIIADIHQCSSINGRSRIIGDNRGNGVPHTAHLSDCQRRMRHLNRVRHDPAARQRTELFCQVFASINCDDAVNGTRC